MPPDERANPSEERAEHVSGPTRGADVANGMRFSYCMLPDYPMAEMVEMIRTADELGFYACYSVDETWHKDPFDRLRRRGPHDEAHPLRAQRHARLPARADAHRPADRHAGRAHRRPRGARRLDGQLRAAVPVPDRLGEAEAAVPAQGGDPRHADVPRRGGDHLRGRLLPLQRPVHVRAAGPGADPDQDGRHEGPALLPRRRARSPTGCTRRSPTRARRTTTRRSTSASAPSGPGATARSSTSAPGW